MNNCLENLTVMVTRPNPAGEILCAYIDSHGGHAINFPTMEFSSVSDQSLFQASINTLSKQDWLIFISPQSVYSSVVALRTTWPQLPEQVKFAAVGAGTANALREAGYVAIFPTNEWSSEGLLDMPEFQHVAHKNIAIIRGEGGRELIGKTLSERGANVSHVIAYQRILPRISQAELDKHINLFASHLVDAVICTSYEGVRNLKILFGSSGWPYLQHVPLIVMSERIITLARELGFQRLWAVRNASLEAILEILAQKKDELCRMKLPK
jgi:uroporphyrinogen-III synthase